LYDDDDYDDDDDDDNNDDDDDDYDDDNDDNDDDDSDIGVLPVHRSRCNTDGVDPRRRVRVPWRCVKAMLY